MKWHYITEEQPEKAGIYLVTLIYPECDEDGEKTGRMMAKIDTRYYWNIDEDPEEISWKMHDQPDHGLIWLEQLGSSKNETVWAWADIEEKLFPEILPKDVTKSFGYPKDNNTERKE